MHVELLADYPEFVPIVAKWRWDEWGQFDPLVTLETKILKLEDHLRRDRIPLSVVALEEGQPVGVASLTLHDMETRKDLSPWLAGVFVPPEFRSGGIASSLVGAIENLAAELGYEEIFLYTNGAELLYAKLGWVELGRELYKGRQVVIMRKMIMT